MPHRNRISPRRAERNGRTRPWLAALLALTLPALAACTETAGTADEATAEAAQPADQEAQAPAPFNAMAAVTPPPPPPPPPVDDNPDQLLGLSTDAVTEKLGKPSLIRREGDAEIWQYRAPRCVLDLFLYGTEKKVEHVDLRDRGDARPDAVRDCFADMLRAAMETS